MNKTFKNVYGNYVSFAFIYDHVKYPSDHSRKLKEELNKFIDKEHISFKTFDDEFTFYIECTLNKLEVLSDQYIDLNNHLTQWHKSCTEKLIMKELECLNLKNKR